MAVQQWEQDFMSKFGGDKFFTDEPTRSKLSKDYYWYSPVLEKQLRDKVAEGIVIPEQEQDLRDILESAYTHQIPVTVRGGGTGNYGQAVPLNGGIVLDLSRLNKILEIGEGFARVQCGVKLGLLEKTLRASGHELCIYPSTYVKATVGGFVCGGSGGIGSITWGNLWDGNVLGAVVYTLEEKPRRLEVEGEELYNYIHNYGTTGIVAELKIRTATKTDWMQTIVQFDDLESGMKFAESLSDDDRIPKRLVSVAEWPIPSYFVPFQKHIDEGTTVVFLETADGTEDALMAHSAQYGGRVKHVIPANLYHKTLGLSDFTWNHTTLWALKKDPTLTYLQSGFKIDKYMEQIEQIKAKFPDEVLFHFEWIRTGGKLGPACLPIVLYKSEERLYEIIAFFESVGARIFDPHTFVLEEGARGEYKGMIKQKSQNDPSGLLNPGKIKPEKE